MSHTISEEVDDEQRHEHGDELCPSQQHSHEQEGEHCHGHQHSHEHEGGACPSHQHSHQHAGGQCPSQQQGHEHEAGQGHSHRHHGHGHHHHHHHHEAEGNIFLGFVLNLFFALVELVGGLYTGSVAILSDALHDFGDSCSLGVAWYLERLSKKGRDQNFSYGYKRFSLLGALLISIILLVGSIFVITESIERIITPSEPHAGGMFVLSLFGLAVNGYAAWRMMGGSSLNERAMRVHLMEDVLGWVAVLVVSAVMYFVDLPILDPILSLCITGWVLYNVYFNLRDNLRIFLQGVPEDVDSEELVEEVLRLEGVLSVHDVHLWTLNGEQHIGTLHLVYDCERLTKPRQLAELKEAVRQLATAHLVSHLTIELDPKGCSCGLEQC